MLWAMSLLELKQEVCRLSKRDRQELFVYMLRLRHETPEWRRGTAKRIQAMKAGRRVPIELLETRIAHG
jgi:hypothetical protein